MALYVYLLYLCAYAVKKLCCGWDIDTKKNKVHVTTHLCFGHRLIFGHSRTNKRIEEQQPGCFLRNGFLVIDLKNGPAILVPAPVVQDAIIIADNYLVLYPFLPNDHQQCYQHTCILQFFMDVNKPEAIV